ncbi:MAG TPA: ATP synthase F1 subunit delta [Verrucomicrobiae bacterium]|jgi:F-type H+-transporting ATPase subunit delta|nr:ATP synthase F1 subunit delta [Verrucomicrobiae bacterium]
MAAVSGRYARAFAEVIMDQKASPQRAVADLNAIAALVSANAELRTVFQNPSVEHQQKLKLLDAIIARAKGSKMLRNFVAVLIDQRRIGQIEDVARQFQHELNERMGIAEAQVSSARDLAAAEKKSLEKRLAATTGKEIDATYMKDESLLGGALVRIGSTVYDGSVRGQMQRIKEQITGS